MKLKLKAPGTFLLTLKYDEPLSTFASKFNLRRYTLAYAPFVPDAERAHYESLAQTDLNNTAGR